MGARPGVLFLALLAIPFVNLGQLPTQDCPKYEDPDSMNFALLSSSLIAFVYCNSVGSPKASSELKRS